MTVEFQKFQPGKLLPAKITDFVLRDQTHGIKSPEFMAAVAKGDTANIMDGIDSIIMNAEMRFGVKLSDEDKFRMQMMAEDAIVTDLLGSVAKKHDGRNVGYIEKVSEYISGLNVTITNAFERALKGGM